jgi:hypothetical protein
MDESAVRECAEDHGRAVVEGDLRRAGKYLTDSARDQAGAVMAKLPTPITDAQVVDVEQSGSDALAHIRYSGGDRATTVVSRWADRAGQPMIVGLEVLETA